LLDGHIRRTLIVQGDVRETLPRYLADNPHTVIALAYFDLDLYEPTRESTSYPPRDGSLNSGPLRAGSSRLVSRATKKCCTAIPASVGELSDDDGGV
jgi:hypothetical protein